MYKSCLSLTGVFKSTRTGGIDKGVVVLRSQERIGQVSEELLQKAGDAVHVMEEVFGVSEIKSRIGGVCLMSGKVSNRRGTRGPGTLTCIEHALELVDVIQGAGLSVDALETQAEEVDSLYALVDHHGHS